MKVYPVHWRYVWITLINWTIFVLIASGFSNWLLLRENRRLEAERITCEQKWEEINKKIEAGEIKIVLEKEDL